MISVEYLLVAFTDLTLTAFDIPKLRGYFSRKYADEPLFHNHPEPGKSAYRYPAIQYRVYRGHPALIGIGEGINALKKIILDSHNITIGNSYMPVNELQIDIRKEEFGQCEDMCTYRFISPWMALNQENYREYIKTTTIDQKARLLKILRGNLLTISKAFSYTIPDLDSVKVEGSFRTVSRNFHNIPMHCFTGRFGMNFKIPDHLALGKQVTRGFGVVEYYKEER
jgi:CRISPR/Cas system endoribonuclease Cas6 (RAMP superfamily)